MIDSGEVVGDLFGGGRKKVHRSCWGCRGLDIAFPLTLTLPLGERFPRADSRIEPLNHPLTRPSATLSPTGREGRVRGQLATGGFMGREQLVSVLTNSGDLRVNMGFRLLNGWRII